MESTPACKLVPAVTVDVVVVAVIVTAWVVGVDELVTVTAY